MKAFVAVVRREILEKKFVLWVALLLAIVPFLVPAVRQQKGASAREIREVVAFFLALGMAGAVAGAMGSSSFSGELAARRMGFYFSRPISSFALWAGKLAAAAVLVAFVLVVSLAPVALVNGSRLVPEQGGFGIAVLVAGSALILLVVHTLSLIVRSRSALAFVDLVASAAVALVAVSAASRLRRGAFVATEELLWVVGIALALALVFASYRAVARGRTDIRAAHAGSSIALWAVLGPAALGFAGYAAWALAAPASAVSRVESASAIGSNGWVAVEGRARGLRASFLYDARSGRSQRYVGSTLVTDPGDRVAAWFVAETLQGPWTIHTLRLDEPNARERETKVVLRSRWAWPTFLSQDGARLAAIEGNILNVYELETGRTLASFPVKGGDDGISGRFVSPEVVRLLRVRLVSGSELRRAEILEADVRTRRLAVVGTADDLRGWSTVLTSPYRDELLVNEGRGARIAIRDPRTLAVRSVLREGEALRSSSAHFRADGGIVLGLADETKAWLEVFTPERVPPRRIPLGPARRVRLAGETSDGRVLAGIVLSDTGPGQSAHELYAADLADGTVRRITDRLSPTLRWWWWWEARRTEPGSEGTKLFLSDDQKLIRFDPVTGERRVLLGGR